MDNAIEYYATQGIVSDPGAYAGCFDGLPDDIPGLCKAIQGILVHVFWAERMGLQVLPGRQVELNLRWTSRRLAHILELDGSSLSVARPLDKRSVGNCRDFTLMLTAMLRHKGIPARARCGFSTYFLAGSYEDHWVCEYWNAPAMRWVMVDPQLDAFQRRTLAIPFDPCDMPANQFIPAGAAWQMCRAGDAEPDRFGIFKMRGLWFIRGDLGRDFAALNKIEMLPWDGWGIVDKTEDGTPDENAFLDRVAALTLAGGRQFGSMRSLYEEDERLRVSPSFRSYPAEGRVLQVELGD